MRRVLTILSLVALAVAAYADARPAAAVDPRGGGLEVGLGEWTVALAAKAIRPGEVTFVIANRGKHLHGFRIRSGREEDRGRGRDRFEARSRVLRPGETARVTVKLDAGFYTVDCFVEGHDNLGMETTLEVRADAPLVQPRAASGRTVEIAQFAFRPQTLRVPVGASVRWTNADAAPHTATSTTGTFTTPQLRKGGTHRHTFKRAGRYPYVCALHPAMRGTVIVTRRRP